MWSWSAYLPWQIGDYENYCAVLTKEVNVLTTAVAQLAAERAPAGGAAASGPSGADAAS